MSFESLTSSNVLAEVDVLKENKIGDHGLIASKEVSSILEEITKFVEGVDRGLGDGSSVLIISEAHLGVANDGFVSNALQLVSSGPLSGGGAESSWQMLASDILMDGKGLRESHIAIDNIRQVAEGHEGGLVLGPVGGASHVGSLFPVGAAMSEHETSDVSTASTSQVEVSKNKLVLATSLLSVWLSSWG